MKKTNKAILLDLGTVLVTLNFKKMILQFGKVSPIKTNHLKEIVFGPVKEQFESGNLSPYQFYKQVSRMAELNLPFTRFREIWCNIFSINQETVEFILSNFKKGNLHILSNTDPMHFLHVFRKFPVFTQWGEPVLSFSIGIRKPDLRFYKYALKKINRRAQDCIFIDDLPDNVESARKCGISSVQYLNFTQMKKDLDNIL